MVIVTAIIAIGILVFIHEGGHFLAARAFGVRVTEFMLGLPGPNIGFIKNGTKFGVTCIPLGGYARVCGMTHGDLHPKTKEVLASVYSRGSAVIEQIALDAGVSVDEAEDILFELEQWGSVVPPKDEDEYNVYRTAEVAKSKHEVIFAEGSPREFESADALFESEFSQQYRAQKVWKRCVIVLAGIFVNLVFAILCFVVVYSVIGVDIAYEDGTTTHFTASFLQSIQAGFTYIWLTIQAILQLLNPATTAEVVSQSTSIVGIAYLSNDYFSQGLSEGLLFMGMISASLGLMNLIPIPPLDGGHFIIEIIQKIIHRNVSEKAINIVSYVGLGLLLALFVVTLNQDIQRFIFGNWG